MSQQPRLPSERVIVALDLASRQEAVRLVEVLGEACNFYKVGPVLFYREGPPIIEWLRSQGKHVFLDLKAHDIPSVVESATEAAVEMGVTFFTAHVADGSAAAAVKAARRAQTSSGHNLFVLGVTVLTSSHTADAEAGSGGVSFETLLSSRVGRALSSGCDGIVAAAPDLPLVSDLVPHGLIKVCPGIRPSPHSVKAAGDERARTPIPRDAGRSEVHGATGKAGDDQARTATPREAAEAGADFIVVGRVILESPDPLRAFRRIEEEFSLAVTRELIE